MEWLVSMQFSVPVSATADEVAARTRAEAARAAELAAAGHLRRVWRVPGRWANWGLWAATDATHLHEMLASLPLFEWAEITVHPLARHPSDPPPTAGPDAVPSTP